MFSIFYRFLYLRRVLEAKLKDLARRGVGSEVKRADAFSKSDEQLCWEKRIFGSDSAECLLYTVYFYNCKLFHLRGCDEHRRITLDDIKVSQDNMGRKYVDFNGKTAKNNQGDLRTLKKNIEAKALRYYAQDNDFNIVDYYSEYIQIVSNLNADDRTFYRRPLSNIMSSIRYSKQPMGINYLSKIIPTIASKAELKGRYTAHSGKATGISQMYDAGIAEITIQERSGNRSLDSLRKYSRSRSNLQTINASAALAPTSSKKDQLSLIYDSQVASTSNDGQVTLTSNSVATVFPDENVESENGPYKCISSHGECIISPPPSKRLIIEANGDTNVVKFSFV